MWAHVVLSIATLASPARAQDDDEIGHFTVQAGAVVAEEDGALAARAALRSELAFRLAGPLSGGAFLQAIVADDPMGSPPGFGGGLLLALRPELPLLGFVPHLEVTGGRVQLPSRGQLLIDAWSIGIGAGIGYRVAPQIALEARGQHQWWLAMSPGSALSGSAWTVAIAATIDLP